MVGEIVLIIHRLWIMSNRKTRSFVAKERLQIVTLLRPFGATEGQAETALQRAARRLWGVAKQNQPPRPKSVIISSSRHHH
ncbi:hypothetical protein A3A67_00615 [Candidatus Peribacteria bacterium RIFCSPLOWO2_01_FULL_51_18]|nr:MAG: hypothetical protein A3A67_00615 [Candidatus Peribacteria bacterium RIFCSPLOWO2_01_FULL_51_18]